MHTWAGSALTGSVKHLIAPTCSGNKEIERPRTIYLAADTSLYPKAYRSSKDGSLAAGIQQYISTRHDAIGTLAPCSRVAKMQNEHLARIKRWTDSRCEGPVAGRTP